MNNEHLNKMAENHEVKETITGLKYQAAMEQLKTAYKRFSSNLRETEKEIDKAEQKSMKLEVQIDGLKVKEISLKNDIAEIEQLYNNICLENGKINDLHDDPDGQIRIQLS